MILYGNVFVNFFDSVVDFFSAGWEALCTFARYLGMVVSNVLSAITFMLTSQQAILVVLEYMPFVIGGCATAVLAIAVIRIFLK